MPSWKDILEEINTTSPPTVSSHDIVRRKYLNNLYKYTKRNVIIYYSGWLQKGTLRGIPFQLNDSDKNGFMTTIHKLDRSKGLDLILHTPGGEMAATESLVDYLRAMFGTDIRAIIPQLAMSAGTMIALACKEIVMGKHSSLGPIDPQYINPQYGRFPAHGITEELKRAAKEIKKNPEKIPLWQAIIAKYSPTLIGECEHAIRWANTMVKEWLSTGMFKGDKNARSKAGKVVKELGTHSLTLSHDRHISIDQAKNLNLNVVSLEEDSKLQDLVLSIHHACVHTLQATNAYKIIENHNGVAFIQLAQAMVAKQ